MRQYITLVFLFSLSKTISFGAPVRFDFDSVDPQPIGSTQAGWTPAPAGNGSDGTVSIATTAVGAVTVDTRNRAGTAADAGGGDEADMWNDFVFANGSFDSVPGSGLQISVTGLAPESSFPITIWAFDDGSPPVGFDRATDWNVDTTLTFPGGPDPETLLDYNVTITASSDAAGNLMITGIVAAIDPSTSHNVFINGIEIGDPLADADEDGLEDTFEQRIIDANPGDGIATLADVRPGDDFDSDNSTNAEEEAANTDPTDPDSDDDNYPDGAEDNSGMWAGMSATGTDPNRPDTDGDGLLDGVENPDLPYDANDPESQPGTDPNLPDTDEDGRDDGREVLVNGTDPTDGEDFFDPIAGAIALFDFQDSGGPTLEGWTAADLGNGSNGNITVATEAVGGVTVDIRDRDQANTDGGGDVVNNDMWRDFVFANGSFDSAPGSGLRITLTGLQPFGSYPVTIWAFDESSNEGRDADWGAPGEDSVTLAFPTTPDPQSLEDYMVVFEVEANESGVAIIEGIVAAVEPDVSHNVFVNGLAVGPPIGGGIPFQITEVTYDGTTVSITWNSTPDVPYGIFVSSDLKNWSELDDGFISQGTATTFEYSGPIPDPPAEQRLYFRIER